MNNINLTIIYSIEYIIKKDEYYYIKYSPKV